MSNSQDKRKDWPVVWFLIPPDEDVKTQVYFFPNYFECFEVMRPRTVFAVTNGWTTVCEPFDPNIEAHVKAKKSYDSSSNNGDVASRVINKIDRRTSGNVTYGS